MVIAYGYISGWLWMYLNVMPRNWRTNIKRFKVRTLLWVILLLLVALLMSTGAAQAASTCKNGEWKIIPGQNPGISSALRSVAAVSQNDVWSVGETNYIATQTVKTLIEFHD